MNIALTLVGLHHEQIGHMATNMVFITGSITTKYFLEAVGIRKLASHL
jgi:hypothetical protein